MARHRRLVAQYVLNTDRHTIRFASLLMLHIEPLIKHRLLLLGRPPERLPLATY